MKIEAILMPFGPLDDVDDGGVGEHHRDQARSRCHERRARQPASVTARAAEPISTSTPVAYAPPCGVDVGVEDDRDEEGDAR